MIYVVCAVIYREGKILIAQRSEKMKLPLKWEFPGGKLKKGENEEQAITREIKEELNIEILPFQRISSHTHDYGSLKINLIAYLCEYISGEIKLLEHLDFEFVYFEDLKGYDFAEADIPVIEKLKTLL
ncbi:(deoxy)nucleoside triphosphate pyrophosphohydrolase [Aequorivita antarctica]|uniref:8-oxo-dGTP diphosphatase n=1 Tax=Aequorivita antarctica TaxID=153266 RepID=A0A5C6Z039_9FLAO|nr:(deoxy)nucleoside triphosphate pyrophosphohydrolase [Aequorivita antarctica]TXD72870.1 (deoxy)nucleoside triphosphate pyrophosphohydrolase [Aequorivita antarctica]SRX76253.1 CTP pyrophosphohydrolase [Aequorivita antarctica]